MPNVNSIISKHNKTVLDPPTNNIKSRQLPSQNILWHYRNQIQTAIGKPHKILQT